MSMFDKLCRIAERYRGCVIGPGGFGGRDDQKSLIRALRTMPLFDFSETEAIEGHNLDDFLMPFDALAIEVPGTVILVWDHNHEGVGLGEAQCEFGVSTFGHIIGKPNWFLCADWMWSAYVNDEQNKLALSVGAPFITRTVHGGSGALGQLGTEADWQKKENHEAIHEIKDTATDFFLYTIAALSLANHPNNWIVTRENVKARPLQRGKIPRSDQRPRYIVVSDKALHRTIRLPNPENKGTVRPHRRRAHFKTLTAERFRFKRGQRVRVSACWVGPKESVYGGERYVVCTDL